MGRITKRFHISKETLQNIVEWPVVVMGTLSARETRGMASLLEDAGAEPRLVPPFRTDRNPVGLMWSEEKESPGKAKARTLADLVGAVAKALSTAAPENERAVILNAAQVRSPTRLAFMSR